jgi:hypothetical protein
LTAYLLVGKVSNTAPVDLSDVVVA